MRIRERDGKNLDPGWEKFGSGINIPDLQHGYYVTRRKMRLIEGNAKCRRLKKWPVKQWWAKWRSSTFDLYPGGEGHGVQGQICDILRPQLTMNRFLHLCPHRFPHFGYINLGGGGALILDRWRAYDLFASVDAHLCCTGILWQVFICLRPRTTYPLPLTHCIQVYVVQHTVLIHTEKGGGGELNQREGERVNSSQSWVENTNMTNCISSSVNSDKHLPQSSLTGQFLDDDILLWCLRYRTYLVDWSICYSTLNSVRSEKILLSPRQCSGSGFISCWPSRIRILPINKKKIKKNLDSFSFVTSSQFVTFN